VLSITSVFVETLNDATALVLGEKFRSLREVGHEEPSNHGDDHCDRTLNDIDPAPASQGVSMNSRETIGENSLELA